MTDHPIGKPFPRKEGRKKVTGQALYVDDLSFPDMLHGATVRSPVARGKITNISFEGDIPWDEFVIVTAKDIPGANYVALILNDQPYLADGFVNHPEEPVLLLAHKDKYLVEEARRNVRIEIEELPAIFSLEDSLAKKEIIWGEDNVFKKFLVDKGNVDDAWASADLIVEGEYETGAQEQLYIENNGAIAIANPTEGVTVWGSMQCPYYVHKALVKLFELARRKDSHHSNGNGRRLWRQRRISVADRRTRCAARVEVRQACEDHLRSRGRHGRDHEAPSVAYATQNRRYERRQTARDGDRFRHRWRRLLHALARRAFTRNDSRCWSIRLSQRSYSQPRGRDERSAARRVQRFWRAAEHLRARTAHG